MDVFNALGSTSLRVAAESYYKIGYPILSPPRVRGSMLLILDARALDGQTENVRWGSAIDTGGFAAGYFGTSAKELADSCRLDGMRFLALLHDIEQLDSEDRKSWDNHVLTPGISNVMEKYLPRPLMELLGEFRGPQLYCEVCLSTKVLFEPRRVFSLYCPNTYQPIMETYGLTRLLPGKLKYYNPLFGIERVASDALSLDRNI